MTTPNSVAEVPIIKPTKKNIFLIEKFWTPIDFKIPMSRVLFFTKIVKPDIILNAATTIINESIFNYLVKLVNAFIFTKIIFIGQLK